MSMTVTSTAEIPLARACVGASLETADVRVCVVQDTAHERAATFLQAQAERLPARVQIVHGVDVVQINKRPLLAQSVVARGFRRGLRRLLAREWEWELTWGYLKAFRRFRPQVVLAQFGDSGVRVREACRLSGIPLIVHFHGLDASRHQYLHSNAATYPLLFRDAAAVIGVSRAMCRQLVRLGAPEEKVRYSPYGVDCTAFQGAEPERAAPIFLATGRFVEKKAPHLTILAFARVNKLYPEARLHMIGDGPLLAVSRDIVAGLGLTTTVRFLGARTSKEIQEAMRGARAFVQHSATASDGDCEGTPVAIIEAGASGLPVVATRHAGIPDVVIDGSTGYLVDERDVDGMAAHMIRLAGNADLAGRLGATARERVQAHFSIEVSIRRLWSIIASASAVTS